jgi:hypothetical protein
LSIRPSQITQAAAQFNEYLKDPGRPAMLETRRKVGELRKGATEPYSKHVRTIFQAGAGRTQRYATVLGYPVEIVSLQNPYDLGAGDPLRVRLLVNGASAGGIEALALGAPRQVG